MMAAPRRPREDADLDRMDNDRLLKEVSRLTAVIETADPARLRRDRAMRILRSRDVPRVKVAAVAKITPGAVKNLIDALNRREAKDATGPAAS